MKSPLFRSIPLLAVLFLAGSASAQAAQYDIKQMTPEVSRAIANRQARYAQLQTLKSAGQAGENNRGYAEALGASPQAIDLVEQENRDRRVIYQTIAEQNNLGPSGIPVIETVFADVQREKAQPGDSVQLASGEWVQK